MAACVQCLDGRWRHVLKRSYVDVDRCCVEFVDGMKTNICFESKRVCTKSWQLPEYLLWTCQVQNREPEADIWFSMFFSLTSLSSLIFNWPLQWLGWSPQRSVLTSLLPTWHWFSKCVRHIYCKQKTVILLIYYPWVGNRTVIAYRNKIRLMSYRKTKWTMISTDFPLM